jgi:DNA-binding LacI/PurR family transcriptional regulator
MSSSVPTIKEIARRLNVSVSTVSRALSDHPRIGFRTKQRVRELAKELNYEPNPKAIFFKQGKSFVVGVILPNIKEDFFSQAISGIEDTAMKHGYTILFGQSHDSLEKEKQVLEAMKRQRVDGLLVSLSKETNRYQHFRDLKKYNIPIVYFDRVPDIADVNLVYSDLYSGTIKLVHWLFGQGRKRIALINGPDQMTASRDRLNGYIQGISGKKIKVDMQLVENSDFSEESTDRAVDTLLGLKNRPDAIISFNDYVHLDAVKRARQHKVKINKDILFASYANITINKYTAFPPAASLDQAPYLQGEYAMQMMVDMLGKDKGKVEVSESFLKREVPVSIVTH